MISALFLASCGTVKRGSGTGTASLPVQPSSAITNENPEDEASIPAAMSVAGSEMNRVINQLHSAHSEWQGTPYRLGGAGMNGIDCSAFTQVVYSEFFGTSLPRNTRQQLGEGQGVRRNHVRPGDLIFFRTGRRTLHVGIAMGNGDFLHASVSRGVMISNLSESYWAGRFLGVRRIL